MLGPVAAGKTPLFPNGPLVGEASVGFQVATRSAAATVRRPADLHPQLLGVLAVGVLRRSPWRLAKLQTFGLVPSENRRAAAGAGR